MVNSGPPSPLRNIDYEAIEDAVMETERGRWFLAEYARRNRHADTELLLTAIRRLHDAVIAQEQLTAQAQAERAQAQSIAAAIQQAGAVNAQAEPLVVAPAPGPARSAQSAAQSTQLTEVRTGLFEMAEAIAETRREIASIRPKGGDDSELITATEELDAIVATTEKATSSILEAAEQVQEIAWELRENGVDPSKCEALDDLATNVYTACSFQDLTGQRSQKVVRVLRFIERRITTMINIWGLDELEAVVPGGETLEDMDKRPDSHLLNGPQMDGHGADQGDVDELIDGRSPTAAAAVEIDASAAPDEAPVTAAAEIDASAAPDEAPVTAAAEIDASAAPDEAPVTAAAEIDATAAPEEPTTAASEEIDTAAPDEAPVTAAAEIDATAAPDEAPVTAAAEIDATAAPDEAPVTAAAEIDASAPTAALDEPTTPAPQQASEPPHIGLYVPAPPNQALWSPAQPGAAAPQPENATPDSSTSQPSPTENTDVTDPGATSERGAASGLTSEENARPDGSAPPVSEIPGAAHARREVTEPSTADSAAEGADDGTGSGPAAHGAQPDAPGSMNIGSETTASDNDTPPPLANRETQAPISEVGTQHVAAIAAAAVITETGETAQHGPDDAQDSAAGHSFKDPQRGSVADLLTHLDHMRGKTLFG